MPHRLRHAICNEVFENWTFADACRAIRKAGYSGIEIAPFTLAEDPATLTPAGRRECRDIMASEGLQFVGLHWLMVSPKGLHVTTPDTDLRCRSWQHIRHLIDLCADLGPDGILVFGSPKQRGTTAGRTMFDCHNAIDETEPHAALVECYYDLIRHIHVNELDGRHPGTGSYDFKPLFDVLRRREYGGWISLEAFDFTPGAETIARESLRHLETQ